jgi:glucose-1-phosphate adenylyltransferase
MTAVGVIFSSMNEENVPELSEHRTMASVPFGGRYRMIDFALTNMVNAGITTVGIMTKSNYQSLIDHLGSGKEWDLARKDGGIVLLPPYIDENETMTINSRLEALKGVLGFLDRRKEDYVVLSDSDCVAHFDLQDVIRFHEQKQAEITLVTHRGPVVKTHYYITLKSDENDRVNSVKINPMDEKEGDVFVNIMVLKREYLISLVRNAISCGYTSFGRDILAKRNDRMRIYNYRFQGYYAGITSMAAYFKHNMEMLDGKVRQELFGARDVYTKVKDSAPTKYGMDAVVSNSLISDGCQIEGTVINSILFRGVKVARGAVVENCILMQDNVVGEGAKMNCVITDKNVVVRAKRNLSGCEDLPYFIQKGMML